MTGDQLVEKGADRLHELANRAAARGDGVGEWLSKELRDDAAFLRKLKPSLIAARARGETATEPNPGVAPPAAAPPRGETATEPSPGAPPPAATPPQLTPQPPRPKSKGKRNGPPPIAIVAAAFVAGIVLAKVVDWRGHAHPRD